MRVAIFFCIYETLTHADTVLATVTATPKQQEERDIGSAKAGMETMEQDGEARGDRETPRKEMEGQALEGVMRQRGKRGGGGLNVKVKMLDKGPTG